VVAALNELSARFGFGLVLLSHHPDDYKVLRPLSERLDNAVLLPDTLSAAETKWLTGRCSHVLTSRMHVAIAALGMGVPVSCFASRGKFHGLVEHFGLDAESVCLGDAATQPREVLEPWLERRLEAGREEAGSIASRLEAVRSLARQNFCGVGDSAT
jgi:polysaccharide pyruvyl transferase WcaK-like protein